MFIPPHSSIDSISISSLCSYHSTLEESAVFPLDALFRKYLFLQYSSSLYPAQRSNLRMRHICLAITTHSMLRIVLSPWPTICLPGRHMQRKKERGRKREWGKKSLKFQLGSEELWRQNCEEPAQVVSLSASLFTLLIANKGFLLVKHFGLTCKT